MGQGAKKIGPVKRVAGEIRMPGDKSISHRAIMLGAIAKGPTKAKGVLDCDDSRYTINAFQDMGVSVKQNGEWTVVEGRGLNGLTKPKGPIYVGDSGTSMRLLAGILAGQGFETTITSDKSLLKRPMKRIAEPLSMMGAKVDTGAGGYPPITIKGPVNRAIEYKMPVASAQVKSAILLAGLYLSGITTVEERFRSRDHTERMLKYFGANLKIDGLKTSIEGKSEMTGRVFEIPGDISSASFFIVAAILLKGSKIRIRDVNINPTRAGILDVLSEMGAKINISNKKEVFEPVGDIEVESSQTSGVVIDEDMIPGMIDELPILCVLASLSRGSTVIKGAKELKLKETDRILSMKKNLERMGATIKLEADDIVIEGVKRLHGASLQSFGDHRTCMAMATAALAAEGSSEIDGAECVNKSFPRFFETLEELL